MGRVALKSDCDGLEQYTRKQNRICSLNLLNALVLSHGEPSVIEPPEPLPLPPIPNSAIARACQIAFPAVTLGIVEQIQRAAAAEFYPITLMDICSQRRTKMVVRARQVAMFVAKEMTARSLPEIGRRFGGRDHTTVLHAVRKIEELSRTDLHLAAQIDRIKAVVPGAP